MDGKTYVKLLVGFEKTSALILPLTILSFRSKKYNASSSVACIVNWIFPVLTILLRYSKNKETQTGPCVQTTNTSSRNLFHVVELRSNARALLS